MKLKRDERGEVGTFSKRWYALYETVKRGGEHYLKAENYVPYHVCSLSIAWSLTFALISWNHKINSIFLLKLPVNFGLNQKSPKRLVAPFHIIIRDQQIV